MVAKRSARGERTRPSTEPATDPDRPGRAAGPVRREARCCAGRGGRRAAAPPWRRRRLRGPHRAARTRPARGVPGAQIERLDDLIVPLVTVRAPGLLSLYGVGPDTAAMLLIAAGDHPERLRSEAAWAHMCAVAPIPASSGKRAAPAEPRREPRGQPCPVADRDHPDERPPRHPRLRPAAHRGGTAGEGHHPLPEALRRSRGLPLPAQLTAPQTPGAAWPANRLPQTCWPSNNPPAAPAPSPAAADLRDLIRACPPPGAAHPCLVRLTAVTHEPEFPAKRKLDKHRSIARRVPPLQCSLRYVINLGVRIGAQFRRYTRQLHSLRLPVEQCRLAELRAAPFGKANTLTA